MIKRAAAASGCTAAVVVGVVGPHAADDDAAQVPLVGTAGLPPGLVLGALAVDVVTRGRVATQLRDVHQVQLRWSYKSTRELAETLTAQGHPVSDDTVGRLLREQGYRLQRTVKTLEGAQHTDRDPQFRYLNEQARTQLAAGQPVVSVDAKKKELVAPFANGAREWQPLPERHPRSDLLPAHRAGGLFSGVQQLAVAALPDGQPIVISGSGDGTIRLWDAQSGTPRGGHGWPTSATPSCLPRWNATCGHRPATGRSCVVGALPRCSP